ncbi:domain found in IF2B/IF5-domain-containing protein [Pisolithus orientalis]|uniref:domain found in IF2B/IF5-domain-containing protein n=1 Tax=Pisolithus orientalis TaxID=936130 RepID=UPI002224C6C1|nr:domain found in IF2B/IF5-domain-containing protein [Pisolithus orientalis]KAI6025942.1 domain found in IF2B/IF5-domain-containing protein [Pisolithus orientalis]
MPAAGIVNIRRDVDDKFYRYRMPLLLTKIEGKGNGIKTVIPNMSDVARALSRPPSYITKFFGCELGAQTPFDEKNDRYIVNGAHDAIRLRELLDGFIDKFVLCASCKNPETDLNVVKNGRREDIFRDCKACGERTNIDMRHKLVTFILKNPPKNPKKSKKGKGEAANNGNGGGVHASGPTIPGQEEDGSGGDTDDELTRKIKAEAADLTNDTVLGNDDWAVDTSTEAVKARVKTLEGQMGGLSLPGGDDDGSEDDADSPYSQFGRWVEEHRSQDGIGSVQIYRKAEELGVEKKHKAVLVLVQALFTEDIVKEINTYNALLAKMITSEKHQKALLGGIERLSGLTYTELIPAIPKILMALYQNDVLDEEVVKQWGTHVSKKYVDKETSKKVRKASEPFLKWLEEADDESDEE